MMLPLAVDEAALLDAGDAGLLVRRVRGGGSERHDQAGAGDEEFVRAFLNDHAAREPLAGVEAGRCSALRPAFRR